jgi:hypothetical protein
MLGDPVIGTPCSHVVSAPALSAEGDEVVPAIEIAVTAISKDAATARTFARFEARRTRPNIICLLDLAVVCGSI